MRPANQTTINVVTLTRISKLKEVTRDKTQLISSKVFSAI